jgi:hypothetical protein
MSETNAHSTIHPVARLAAWLAAMVAAFALPIEAVLVLLVMFAARAGEGTRRRWRELVHRTRWLLVAVLVAMTWSVPGEYLIPGFPGTYEGLQAAFGQALSLLAALAAVSWLLDAGRSELVGAIHHVLRALVRPLGRESVADRLAVRVMLVLAQLEAPTAGWRSLLAEDCGDALPGEIVIGTPALAASDRRWVAASLGVAVLLWVAA